MLFLFWFFAALEASQPKPAQVAKQQSVVAMVSEPEVPAEPPPEYEFMVDPPAISRRHLLVDPCYMFNVIVCGIA